MTTTSSDPQPQQQDCPHHVVTMYPTKGRFAPPKRYWSCQDCGANFVPAADLPRATAADAERERIIAMADALEYELPNFEQMKGVETLRKKLQAEHPRATAEAELTVEQRISHDNGKLIASVEEDKWYLYAQTPDGDNYINLDWPETWPKELSAEELRTKGFEIL